MNSSSLNEAIEVLTKELESAFSAYETAEKVADMKGMAVKAAQNEFFLAQKAIDVCINRHDRIQQALDILVGKSREPQSKLENKFKNTPLASEPEAFASPEKKQAPEPAYKNCALAAVDWHSMPKDSLGIHGKSLRFTEPEKDAFLRGVVSWYLSARQGCDLYKINSAIATFFDSQTKSNNWLDNIVAIGTKNGIVTKIRRGVYRLRDFSEIREGGGTYRIFAKGFSEINFIEVAPGLEDNKEALESMAMSLSEFSGLEMSCISIDKKDKVIVMEVK